MLKNGLVLARQTVFPGSICFRPGDKASDRGRSTTDGSVASFGIAERLVDGAAPWRGSPPAIYDARRAVRQIFAGQRAAMRRQRSAPIRQSLVDGRTGPMENSSQSDHHLTGSAS